MLIILTVAFHSYGNMMPSGMRLDDYYGVQKQYARRREEGRGDRKQEIIQVILYRPHEVELRESALRSKNPELEYWLTHSLPLYASFFPRSVACPRSQS
jgi:hypothetical protein